MTGRTEVRYLPRCIVDSLRMKLREVDSNTAFQVFRLAERAYAEGHDDGHARGMLDGYEEAQRNPAKVHPSRSQADTPEA